jgi:DNA repair exonuclease SbcCD ATPase subunit
MDTFSDLRASLQTLSEHSLKTSRSLDDTWYSILEKVSVLRQTIGSLQELSALTKELHENFQEDTRNLAEDVQGQFEGFRDFTKQQEQIDSLEQRIKAGRDKADTLAKRLNEARERIEARAKLEAEREARTTREHARQITDPDTDGTFRTSAHLLGHTRCAYWSHDRCDSLPEAQTRTKVQQFS